MAKIKKNVNTRKFKIGDRVLYKNSEHVIVAYNSNSKTTYAIYKISGGYSHYAAEEELTLIENEMEKGLVKLSLEDAKKLYEQGGNFRTIALSAYPEEELLFTPKDGDFVYVKCDYNHNSEYIYIYNDLGVFKTDRYISINKTTKELFTARPNPITTNDRILSMRLATKEEKKLLLDALHDEGNDWDFINKQIIPYRWRAKLHKKYYYVQFYNSEKSEALESTEDYTIVDNRRFNLHNYFKTKEEAQAIADKISNIFKEL